MSMIKQANIKHFEKLLETESDPSKREMIARLLAEERAKQPPEDALSSAAPDRKMPKGALPS